tara:strand:- start:132 stop:467 length:336 start_codon:yes stop_codon:yes gene_type:complete
MIMDKKNMAQIANKVTKDVLAGFTNDDSGFKQMFAEMMADALKEATCRFAHRPEQLQARACNWGCHCRKKSTCHFPHTPEELAAATTKLQAGFAARLGLPAPAPIVCQACA